MEHRSSNSDGHRVIRKVVIWCGGAISGAGGAMAPPSGHPAPLMMMVMVVHCTSIKVIHAVAAAVAIPTTTEKTEL